MTSADRPTDRLARRGREVRDGGKATADAAGQLIAEAADVAQTELESRPYFTLGLAFGAGLLLGGGLPPKVVSTAASFGLRLALAQVARRVVAEATAGSESTESAA